VTDKELLTAAARQLFALRKLSDKAESVLISHLSRIDLPQNALARMLAVSPQHMNDMIHGRRSITTEMAELLGDM
jgi:plasmid maintenance system antidote protein VapI